MKRPPVMSRGQQSPTFPELTSLPSIRCSLAFPQIKHQNKCGLQSPDTIVSCKLPPKTEAKISRREEASEHPSILAGHVKGQEIHHQSAGTHDENRLSAASPKQIRKDLANKTSKQTLGTEAKASFLFIFFLSFYILVGGS